MLDLTKLKSILLEAGLLKPEELTEAIELAELEHKQLSEVLIERDLISDAHLGQLIAEYSGLNFVDLSTLSIPEDVLRLIPENMARTLNVIAFNQTEDAILLAMNNPADLDTVHLLEKKTGKTVQIFYATERNIKDAVSLYKRGLKEEFAHLIDEQVGQAKRATTDLSVVKILDTILQYAYQERASDVHIEPAGDTVVIRYRIDGVLHDMVTLPKGLLNLLVMRVKILAKLRTDEQRSAQDGKFVQKLEEEDLDIRVSVLPTAEGEKCVLRLLSSRSRQFALEDLGFNEHDISVVRKYVHKPHGMILVTGPTGSGKTTTLYAVLKILNRREVNISTIEDPVEYGIEGINQIQVNNATNLTFASGLRSIVRQDPDIIMIGEIRDDETASIAINSAMTGHLVLSTVHTNDAATTLPRLLDLGVEPFLVASTVQIIIGQRLVRKVCTQCVMSEMLSAERLADLNKVMDMKKYFGDKPEQVRFYRGKGCAVCHQSGYDGRIGVFEVLEVSREIRSLITGQADSDRIKQQAIKEGMGTMFEDGLRKAAVGQTTIDEVIRVLSE